MGDKVVVIGSPNGLAGMVLDNAVSAANDLPGFGSIIQTTAPVSPGSSASPVLNMKGEVVGVSIAQMREGQNLNVIVPAAKNDGLKEKKQATAISTKKKAETQTADIYSTALFYYVKENYQKALSLFNQYLQTHTNSADAWFYAGICYAKSGRHQEAIQAFKEAIRLKPDDIDAHYNLGAEYSNLGRNQEAIAAYKEAIRLKPDYAMAHYNLGVAYGKSGSYQEAIEAYKEAIRLKPDYAMAHYNLGIAYANSGSYQEAIAGL